MLLTHFFTNQDDTHKKTKQKETKNSGQVTTYPVAKDAQGPSPCGPTLDRGGWRRLKDESEGNDCFPYVRGSLA